MKTIEEKITKLETDIKLKNLKLEKLKLELQKHKEETKPKVAPIKWTVKETKKGTPKYITKYKNHWVSFGYAFFKNGKQSIWVKVDDGFLFHNINVQESLTKTKEEVLKAVDKELQAREEILNDDEEYIMFDSDEEAFI